MSQWQLEALISSGFQADGEDNVIPQYPYYMAAWTHSSENYTILVFHCEFPFHISILLPLCTEKKYAGQVRNANCVLDNPLALGTVFKQAQEVQYIKLYKLHSGRGEKL